MNVREWFASLSPRLQSAIVVLVASGSIAVGGFAEGVDGPREIAWPPYTPPDSVMQLVIATVPPGISDYDRDDWSHWRTLNCRTTRNDVLVDEVTDATDLEFRARSDGKQCAVIAGEWFDPYTGETFTDPRDLDIDHLVPLKNAHLSGGWDWDAAERKAYANYLDDPQHLIAVESSANREKGADGPEEWKPAGEYWCQYAVDWIGVKAAWDLTATPDEWGALEEMLATCPGGAPEVVEP